MHKQNLFRAFGSHNGLIMNSLVFLNSLSLFLWLGRGSAQERRREGRIRKREKMRLSDEETVFAAKKNRMSLL